MWRVILFIVVFGELILVLWATGRFDDLAAWIMAQQHQVQTWLAGAIRALRAGESGALAGFLALCFAYGVLHAAGPGHGKLVIGGYGMARRVTARKLAVLSLVSSMAQAAVAVAAVYTIVAAFGLSRQVAGDVVNDIMAPLGSAALAALGLCLALRGARRMLAPASTHDHDHGEGCDCGHAHGPSVQQVQAAGTPREVSALVAGIAMRPCTGAMFVLVLTWQLGLAMAGIAGAFAMGLGTALFTAAVALMSVAARKGAFGGLGLRHAARVLPMVEIGVGLIIAITAGRAVAAAF